jgi:hypothetical protein
MEANGGYCSTIEVYGFKSSLSTGDVHRIRGQLRHELGRDLPGNERCRMHLATVAYGSVLAHPLYEDS